MWTVNLSPVNQKQTAPNKLSHFYLKSWALLPRAASVGVCLAFDASFGLKRAPKKDSHTKVLTNWA